MDKVAKNRERKRERESKIRKTEEEAKKIRGEQRDSYRGYGDPPRERDPNELAIVSL